ncbi:hypothetical protein [Ancylobacter vacuolatus]|uniref:Uncharacterized protein n=1 Tax=Ancylobacter vacuolatus TaxID=223389 RepID=A0ABU0DPM5_9HYPH|nr:hypothetical protein [Ancylobacter vacuolatus]MDQ0350155.1 hypothetical protein [Ancylobacter vacuolatus]
MTLSDFLELTQATQSPLSLVHCTTVDQGVQMLASGELRPTHCGVYDDDLLYLFYGRPAYKPAERAGASYMVELAPMCLVLKPSLLASARRSLPFDSGGFSRYENLIGRGLSRQDFELSGDETAPSRLVTAFYGNNRNYYEQLPLQQPQFDVSRRTARALARLISDTSIRNDDDRCGTIEVQFSQPIRIAEALQAIVAPAAMLADPEVQRILEASPDAIPLAYKIYGRFNPANYASAIYERVEQVLEGQGAFA